MFLHLSIACRKNCGEEVEQVTVTFEHILRFTTDAKKEPLLGFEIARSIVFVESRPGKFLPSHNSSSWSYKRQRTCTN